MQFIFVPTLRCNAGCDYCFQPKSGKVMEQTTFARALTIIFDHLEKNRLQETTLYWQGGEILTISPKWYDKAIETLRNLERKYNRTINHCAQTNLISYGPKWNRIISDLFDRHIGSSLDFPNLYRKIGKCGPGNFNDTWRDRLEKIRELDVSVGVIAVPNKETLKAGAERFYSYYFEELGLESVQINTPFSVDPARFPDFPLDNDELGRFYLDLMAIWAEKSSSKPVQLNPFNALTAYFLDGDMSQLPCLWSMDCTEYMMSVDHLGNFMQCDCWTNYSDFWYGNADSIRSLDDALKSPARMKIKERVRFLVQNTDCGDCSYLRICHGGCPVRALSANRDLFTKDPYCLSHKTLFSGIERLARNL